MYNLRHTLRGGRGRKSSNNNENVLSTDISISTLHLSGSYLDLSSIVSLDEVLVLPLEDMATTSSIEKNFTEKQMSDLPLTSSINAESAVSVSSYAVSSSILQTEKSHKFKPASVVRNLSHTETSNPFKNHLMLPEILKKERKNNQRTPAAISSAAWRKYYEDKEQIKNKNQEAIRKSKLERIVKQKQKETLKETQKLRKSAPKRKKKILPVKVTLDTVDVESQKENLVAVGRTKCAECDDELISDIGEDDEKNIGCDKCIRWYHLKCTKFVGLTYLEVKDQFFECNLCR